MPEPTVPVPIPDLLAAIERLECWPDSGWYTEVPNGERDLIVRGVRDLAARVETLEQENRDALRAVADARLAIAEAEAANTIARAEVAYARAALAGQSTTETPS